ncbi:hypothetical protein cand_007520 [Cryptosporidium andersoni]|uniref:Uncharacterized protein n=1 Tax=Cryptosporidium andersoni TaxID=117008 RepID=A0A1J4MP80_9CRYT|nr:hypothetical protein cand_007520 [Cryptosporidium andersoni]
MEFVRSSIYTEEITDHGILHNEVNIKSSKEERLEEIQSSLPEYSRVDIRWGKVDNKISTRDGEDTCAGLLVTEDDLEYYNSMYESRRRQEEQRLREEEEIRRNFEQFRRRRSKMISGEFLTMRDFNFEQDTEIKTSGAKGYNTDIQIPHTIKIKNKLKTNNTSGQILKSLFAGYSDEDTE